MRRDLLRTPRKLRPTSFHCSPPADHHFVVCCGGGGRGEGDGGDDWSDCGGDESLSRCSFVRTVEGEENGSSLG